MITGANDAMRISAVLDAVDRAAAARFGRFDAARCGVTKLNPSAPILALKWMMTLLPICVPAPILTPGIDHSVPRR